MMVNRMAVSGGALPPLILEHFEHAIERTHFNPASVQTQNATREPGAGSWILLRFRSLPPSAETECCEGGCRQQSNAHRLRHRAGLRRDG